MYDKLCAGSQCLLRNSIESYLPISYEFNLTIILNKIGPTFFLSSLLTFIFELASNFLDSAYHIIIIIIISLNTYIDLYKTFNGRTHFINLIRKS